MDAEDLLVDKILEITAREHELEDIVRFARYYLKDAVPSIPAHVEEALEFYADPKHRNILWTCPVGHSKSTTYGFIAPIWEICRDRNIRILLAAKAMERANESLRRIRVELETNDELVGSFGEFRAKDGPWTDSKLQVERTMNLKGATIIAAGVGGAVEGIRLDEAILDDIIDISSMTSEADRRAADLWYRSTLRPRMDPGGRVIAVGTPWHPNDQYAFFAQNRTFSVLKHQALVKGAPLWPQRFSLAEFTEIRADIGELAFLQKYMCNPQAISGNVWKAEWLQYYSEVPGHLERIVQGWDLAISTKSTADYTVGVTLGVKMPWWYVLDITRVKADFPTALKLIKQKWQQWQPQAVVIESNAYQLAVVQQLRRETAMPVVDQRVTGDKVQRLMGLGVDFETGRIKIKREHADLIQEYIEFPHSAHDDVLDALWLARERLRWQGVTGGQGISIDDL